VNYATPATSKRVSFAIMVKKARWVWVAVVGVLLAVFPTAVAHVTSRPTCDTPTPCLAADDQDDHPAHHDDGEGDRSVALTGLQATMGQGSATLSTSITL
jgi:hypothetical protein